MITCSCGKGTSIKLIVYAKNEECPVTFTCDGKDVFDEDNQVVSYISVIVKYFSLILGIVMLVE